ncbi:uncharacterized protein C16orf86 homolog isoform X2 [Tamandua tetradactyla]|uniref:uncharacterized protein C16orf86 homolog isoform X2 n=1 Tax=Tamandua tetradactyla TaxID=48850 RepID=UPI0040540CB4
MASAGAERRLGTQEGTAVGPAPLTQAPGHRAKSSEGEDKCPVQSASEPELQEKRLKSEERLKPEDTLEEKGHRPMASLVRPGQSPKRKPVNLPGPSHNAHPRGEAEMPPGPLLQREEPEGSQSELSPSAKQHKKVKKRKSLGAPAHPAAASTVSAPSETLRLERKAQRLRPLYQYINYYNPELNQGGEGDRETEAEVEPDSELAIVPEEAGVEQLQALLPVAGELSSGLALPCPSTLVAPTHALALLAEEAGEESGCVPSLKSCSQLKAEVDKSTQVDIDKMLSVCAAPLVPPLSPQYK